MGDAVQDELPRRRFLDLLSQAGSSGEPLRLVLSKYQGSEPDLERVLVRAVVIGGQTCLGFVHRYRTRDISMNLPLPQGLERVDELLGGAGFRQANLHAGALEAQLGISKRGKALLRTARARASPPEDEPPHEAADAAALAHNRQKRRLLSIERPFLQALGVTDSQRQLIPSMARKWKQINRFIEVFADAWRASALRERPGPLRLIDFGSGKGYLTFALHDYLRNTLGVDAHMRGVELRDDLVKACNRIVSESGIEGLAFSQGEIATHGASGTEAGGGRDLDDDATAADGASGARPEFDVMIALHACDTATDDAIHQGIRAGAAIIMCAPCCHKQLRPQLLSPHPLRPILQHGIHLGQQAEMVTDGLRALLLEARGYDTQVFEFISLEHTSKNKMILAVKRGAPRPAAPILAQIEEIKSFYGIREHRLESLLRSQPARQAGQGA